MRVRLSNLSLDHMARKLYIHHALSTKSLQPVSAHRAHIDATLSFKYTPLTKGKFECRLGALEQTHRIL